MTGLDDEWMAARKAELEHWEARVNRRNMAAIPFNLAAGVGYGLGLVELWRLQEVSLALVLLVVSPALVFLAKMLRTGPMPPRWNPPPSYIRDFITRVEMRGSDGDS